LAAIAVPAASQAQANKITAARLRAGSRSVGDDIRAD
jgi:hypothetical protein